MSAGAFAAPMIVTDRMIVAGLAATARGAALMLSGVDLERSTPAAPRPAATERET